MNVLLVNNHYSPASGGAETVVLATERLLREAGHTVAPFAIRNASTAMSAWKRHFPDEDALRKRITRTPPNLTSVYSFEMRRELSALLKRFRPDIAHLHNVYERLTLSVVDTLVAHRVPIVMTLHDYRAVCPNGRLRTHDGICHRCVAKGRFWQIVRHGCLEGSTSRNVKAAVEAYMNRVRGQYRKVDALIAPSAFLAAILLEGGAPPAKLNVIPNPVAPGPPATQDPPEPARFLFAGRLVAEKGLDVLLSAAARAHVRVTIAGSGALEQHLRRRIESEEIPAELAGPLSREGVAQHLRGSTAALVPSLWYENCPMSILEASAQGVPVITSDLGGMKELISHEHDGLLVPPGDVAALARAMTRLAGDPPLVRRLGEAARRRVAATHSPADHLDAIVACYRKAMRSARRVML